MIRSATLALMLACGLAHAATVPDPADFQGRWRVARMVGAADVGTGEDYHELLGTVVDWTATAVKDADGTCAIVRATVRPVATDALQHGIWGGQTVGGLALPMILVAKAFGRDATPVFDDGGKRCSQAVMLNTRQILLMFENGYLYLLDRI